MSNIPQDDPESRVRDQWQARRGIRRGPLEQADIDAIADAAFYTEGAKPTVEFIRRVAGGGSPNTIHPKLDDWFRRARQVAEPSPVPESLLSLWALLQAEAVQVAQDDLAPAIAALAADREALATERARLDDDLDALDVHRAATEQLVTTLREEFRALQAGNDTLRATVTELRTELRDKAEATERLQDELAASEDGRARDARELSEARRTISAREAQAQTLEASLGETSEALHSAQAHGAILQGLVDEAVVAKTDAEHRAIALATELNTARGEVTEQVQRASQLEHALQVAQAAATSDTALREHLANELQRERLASSQAQDMARQSSEALAASEATAAVQMQEIARLHALLQVQRSNKPPSPKRTASMPPK
jgi:chromosome segregation ATPase